jgi:hypothetical protein
VIGARRTVGEPPLGDYRVEALLAMLGRAGDLAVGTLALPKIAASTPDRCATLTFSSLWCFVVICDAMHIMDRARQVTF